MTSAPDIPPVPPSADGAFETLRWVRGGLVRAEAHVARLTATLSARGLSAPPWSAVRAAIEARARPFAEARVRISVPFDASGADAWSCEVAPLDERFRRRRAGIAAVTRVVGTPPPGAPAAEKLFLRRAELQRLAADAHDAEPLLVDASGAVLEGATWNVFAVVGGRLCTPPTGPHVLAGTVRAAVRRAAAKLGLEVVVGAMPLAALARASEVFATNALLPLAPLCSLDGRTLPLPGPCLRALLEVVDADELA